eukprot:s48_g48.t1
MVALGGGFQQCWQRAPARKTHGARRLAFCRGAVASVSEGSESFPGQPLYKMAALGGGFQQSLQLERNGGAKLPFCRGAVLCERRFPELPRAASVSVQNGGFSGGFQRRCFCEWRFPVAVASSSAGRGLQLERNGGPRLAFCRGAVRLSHPDLDEMDSSIEAACRRVEAEDPLLAARAVTMPTRRVLSEEKAEFVLALEDPMSCEIYSRTINNLELKFSVAKTLDEALAAVYSARLRGVPLMVLVDVLEWEPKLLQEQKKGKIPFVVRISIDGKKGPCDAVLAPSEPTVILQQLHNRCIDLWRPDQPASKLET